jgi:hypothetical protein
MSLPMVKIPGVPDTSDAKPGMAFFAGTGPQGKTCGDCAHLGYRRQSQVGHWSEKLQQEIYRSYRVQKCAVFKSMTGRHGANIDVYYHACKYFEPKPR